MARRPREHPHSDSSTAKPIQLVMARQYRYNRHHTTPLNFHWHESILLLLLLLPRNFAWRRDQQQRQRIGIISHRTPFWIKENHAIRLQLRLSPRPKPLPASLFLPPGQILCAQSPGRPRMPGVPGLFWFFFSPFPK